MKIIGILVIVLLIGCSIGTPKVSIDRIGCIQAINRLFKGHSDYFYIFHSNCVPKRKIATAGTSQATALYTNMMVRK